MAVQMPQFNFLDVGQTLGRAEAIKGQRLRNELAGMDKDERQRIADARQKSDEIRGMYDSMPEQIQQLEAAGLFDEAEEVRNSYVDSQLNAINMIEGLRNGINADNYKSFRADMIASGSMSPEFLPVEYSDQWFRDQVDERKGAISKFTKKYTDQGVTWAQDYITQDGEILWDMMSDPYRADTGKGKGGSGGEWGGMKSADSNAIRGMANELFGGFFDPQTGQYAGLTPDKSQKVAALSEEAAKIYSANEGRIPHSEALARAARKLEIDIPQVSPNTPGGANATDPFGWR